MPVVTKQVSVRFFLIEPYGNPLPYPSGLYPREAVFQRLRRLDPSEESYRIRENLFGGETLCFIHDGDLGEVLGAYYKDHLSQAQTEYKGELLDLMLREGEALVEGAFLVFFPNDVVGLVRSSSKAPGPAKVANWLSLIGGVGCWLVPLSNPDTTAQLAESGGRVRRLFLRARKSRLDTIALESPRTAAALRAAAAAVPTSDEVGVEISASEPRTRRLYSGELLHLLSELSDFEDFESAHVYVQGQARPIDLKQSFLVAPQKVGLIDTKKLNAATAAEAITEAYRQQELHVQFAARVQRGQPGEAAT